MRLADDAAISLRSELALAKDAVMTRAFGEHHLTVMIRADQLSELEVATRRHTMLSESRDLPPCAKIWIGGGVLGTASPGILVIL
jgi:hypothetical protein